MTHIMLTQSFIIKCNEI